MLGGIAVAGLLLLAGPAGATPTTEPSRLRKIMAGDRLRITVAEQEDLGRVYPVAGDGSIDFGFVGRLQVENLTIEEAEQFLEERLEEQYFKSATVQVDVADFVEGDILVMGAVKSPGSLSFRGDQLLTLFEAITYKDGLGPNADAREVMILRWKPGGSMEREIIRIDVQSMFSKLDFSRDQFLRARDIVYVPSLGGGDGANEFLVLGEVSRAGFYPYSTGMNMIRLLTMMGGFGGGAQLESTRILRPTGAGGYISIPVDMGRLLGAADMSQNVAIQAGDIIFVPSSRHAAGGRVYLLGEVTTPGAVSLQFDRDNSLAKLLLRAGIKGSQFANLSKVRVLRTDPNGVKRTLTVDVEKIIKTGAFEEDVPLQDDDVIIVPEKIFGF
jgi:protein involved in polysaccharide export with SLBB domain